MVLSKGEGVHDTHTHIHKRKNTRGRNGGVVLVCRSGRLLTLSEKVTTIPSHDAIVNGLCVLPNVQRVLKSNNVCVCVCGGECKPRLQRKPKQRSFSCKHTFGANEPGHHS